MKKNANNYCVLYRDAICKRGGRSDGGRLSHQIDGALEEAGGVQDLVHDGGLEFVGVELLSL